MTRRSPHSIETVWPSRPVRLVLGVLTLGRFRRCRMEFTPTGLREVFPRTERFTPWAGLRWVMPGPARWLFSTMVMSPTRPRTPLRRGLPIAVSQQHAFERTREAFRLFAPDVRILWFGSRRPPAADQPIEDELKRAGM